MMIIDDDDDDEDENEDEDEDERVLLMMINGNEWWDSWDIFYLYVSQLPTPSKTAVGSGAA